MITAFLAERDGAVQMGYLTGMFGIPLNICCQSTLNATLSNLIRARLAMPEENFENYGKDNGTERPLYHWIPGRFYPSACRKQSWMI
ncbi:hypothetical protein [Mycobacterium shimoidei]|uniref:hypothetical protein n=1 Tax=Mycobacterium shimoidei TaxID=29313 RepID=UPI00111BE4B3|nr:hypothetical protein [Mycobacterium shimoidei]MCV7257080.1 hypothetical protein [Mycobacterium shimoidei]